MSLSQVNSLSLVDVFDIKSAFEVDDLLDKSFRANSWLVKNKIERINDPSELKRTILNGDMPLDLSTLRLPSSCDKPIDIIKPSKQEPSKKTKALSGADKKENLRASIKLYEDEISSNSPIRLNKKSKNIKVKNIKNDMLSVRLIKYLK